MSTKGKKIYGVQILRLVCFLFIVAFHAGINGSQIFWGGIEVFFVISSYFLTKKLVKPENKNYNVLYEVKHRVSRLAPIYLVVVSYGFLTLLIKGLPFSIVELLSYLVFSQNLFWMFSKGYIAYVNDYTAHTWTLSIEIYLFLIWVIAFKLIKGNKNRLVFNLFAIISAIVWRVLTVLLLKDALITSVFFIAHMDAFALGSILALLELNKTTKKSNLISGTTVALFGVAFIIVCIVITSSIFNVDFISAYKLYSSSDNYLINAITGNVYLGFSLLGVGLLQVIKTIDLPQNKAINFITYLGGLTFYSYLLHYPIVMILLKKISDRWIVFLISSISSIVLSFALEKIIDFIRKLFNNKVLKEKK